MALAPRDVPITRDNVDQWHRDWVEGESDEDWPTYLRGKVEALGIEDQMVDTSGHDSLDDETHVVDMILADMDSYGYS